MSDPDTDHATDLSAVTPEQFLGDVDAAAPGWSDRYGGPVGIVAECGRMQALLNDQSERIAKIRIAAIQELLKTRSGAEVSAMFGVAKQTISKASKARGWKDAQW